MFLRKFLPIEARPGPCPMLICIFPVINTMAHSREKNKGLLSQKIPNLPLGDLEKFS